MIVVSIVGILVVIVVIVATVVVVIAIVVDFCHGIHHGCLKSVMGTQRMSRC